MRITAVGVVTELLSDGFGLSHEGAPRIEILPAPLDPKEALPGDRVCDEAGDWATVIFNDVVGGQLLVAWDAHYDRSLLPYADVEKITRPVEDHAQAIEDVLAGLRSSSAAVVSISEILRKHRGA